jgi:hypothetical protein
MSWPISSSLGQTARSPERCSRKPIETGVRSFAPAGAAEGPPLAGGRRGGPQGIVLGIVLAVLVLAVLAFAGGSRAIAEDLNDYPTAARSDYVFACMKANGETQEILHKCSCSIDVIASIIPYDRYVTTETILSMSQVTGPVGSEFRSTESARLALQEFRRAQAEAEVRCF